MAQANPHFFRIQKPYIFPVIEEKLSDWKQKNPGLECINMGIADIAKPLAPSIAKAIANATFEMTKENHLRGYGPSDGYPFLKNAILDHEYAKYGFTNADIFISDGANTDTAHIHEIFSSDAKIAITSPTYPVYLDTNLMAGREHIVFMQCNEENSFVPTPPKEHCDLIYLCSPNNPTGVALNFEALKAFVDYAKEHNSVLIVDGAYEGFINSKDVPKSIYEIPGAKEVAIECRTFSKSAGFTGLRCAYCIIPKELTVLFGSKRIPLQSLWRIRQNTKSNGVSYPIQKGAEAALSKEGLAETRKDMESYLSLTHKIRERVTNRGWKCFGGTDSPFVWIKNPGNLTSWEFFDFLLKEAHIISIPGCGFGDSGEGYLRLSCFLSEENGKRALSIL